MFRWSEGFEGILVAALFSRVYATVSGSIAPGSAAGHRSTNPGTSDDFHMTTVDLLDGAADEKTWIINFAFRTNEASGFNTTQNEIPFIGIRSSAGEQLRLEFIAANDTRPGGTYYKLRVMRGATELATTVQQWAAHQNDIEWVDFEFKTTVRTGINGSFSLKYTTRETISTTATWSAANTGINTANQGADGADRMEFSWDTGTDNAEVSFDNIVIMDSTGTVNNDFVGVTSTEALDVTGNGDTLQWDLDGGAASLEDAWNESPTIQTTLEDDKRVSTDVVGDIELATMSDPISARNTTIVGIQTRLYGRMEASGTRDVQFFYRKTTGTPAQIGTKIVTFPDSSMRGFADTLEEDPNTGAPWVIADIDGVQMGVRLDA